MNNDNLIEESAAKIIAGKVILFPSDTNWVLGCKISNQHAIDRLIEISNSADFKPVLLMSSLDMLKEYVNEIHPRIETLLIYNKRPLTIIFQEINFPFSPKILENQIAIRIVHDDFCQKLIDKIEQPVLSVSVANKLLPYTLNFSEIDPLFKEKADFICKVHESKLSYGLLSILVSFNQDGELQFIRT